MDAGAAHGAVLSSIAALNGRVVADQAPTFVQFEVNKRNIWITAGVRLWYRCEATITPAAPMQSTVRVSSRIDWGRAAPFIALNLIALLLIGVLIVPIIIVGWTFWHVSVNWSKEISETVVRGLGASISRPAMAAAAAYAPPPQPQSPSEAGKSEEVTVHDQLRKLKELHDGGVLTDEEFAAKKTELLARL